MRPSSAMSNRRPMGPRDLARASSIKVSDIELALERTLSQMERDARPRTPSPPPQSRSPRKRPPLESDHILTNGSPATPVTPDPPQAIEPRPPVAPLSIKKTSVRTSGSSSPRKDSRELTRIPSLTMREDENVTLSTISRNIHDAPGKRPFTRATTLAEQTWEDVRALQAYIHDSRLIVFFQIERSQRSVKRIRLEINDMVSNDRTSRPSSPTKRAPSRPTVRVHICQITYY